MKKIVFAGLCAGLLLTACQPKKGESPDVDIEQIKADIQGVENTYAAAANSSDADGVLTYYAEDAVSYEQESAPLEGHQAIKASLTKQFAQSPKGTTIGFVLKEVHPSSDGNQVVEIGRYTVKDSTGTGVASGHYFALFEKKDGKYICTRDISTPDTKKK